jgi:uncharacterized heparinase superfamily protein
LSLLPEILRALLRAAAKPWRVFWRRTWLYRRLLKGKLSDHIAFYPYDALPRRLEDADALLRGRFRFAGETVDVREGSIFDKPAPSDEWLRALHGFDWLPPLSAAGGEAARTLATNLITQWLKRYARYSEPAWDPQVIAQRLMHVFAHGRFVLSNSDVLWRSRMFVSLREQARMLARIAGEARPGLPRLQAAAAHALSGACLDDSPKRLASGLQRLEAEIVAQILPDGGHASRSPEALVHAYRYLVMVCDALTAIGQPTPAPLRSAHDRMAPMLRFFRHGDGALALFNGGAESDPRMIAGLLARDEVRGQPFVHAPHSGYQRLGAAKTLVVIDCGIPPKGAFSNTAHAGCLSFEMSSGTQRIVVNCGAATPAHAKWESALRATAAHSTVTVADTSMAAVLSSGFVRDLLGARLLGGPRAVDAARAESSNGWTLEASHDGYVPVFGVMHERRVTLALHGTALTGGDKLIPQAQRRHEPVAFAIRFHIHPDVRVSPSQGGGILLKLPNGEGWRFRAGGGSLSVEESVYLGGDTVRRTEQLVIAGTVQDTPVELAWVFEQIGVS